MTLDLTATAEKPKQLISSGILLSLANPYWFIWWATIGMGYIVYAMKFGTLGVVSFFLGHIASDFLWYTCISYTVAKGKRFISDAVYSYLLAGCGLFLLCFSGYFLYDGVNRLLS